MNDELTAENPSQGETIAQVMGRIPSGIFILTAADGGGRTTGMMASWVQQASFEPPMVTVAVNRQRYLIDWLQQHPHLALNVVGESQKGFLKHFARGFAPGEPAFEGMPTAQGQTGVPVLAEAQGYLEGRIADRMDAGDHVIYLLEIIAAGAGATLGEERPMVHIRKSGANY